MNTSPNMQNTLLSRSSVINIRKYRDVDFDFILEHMVSAGFCIDAAYSRLHQVLPIIDKFYWKPCRTILSADKNNGKVNGHNIIHHGIHHMIARSGPKKLTGMSHLMLLGEALSSAANLYFCLTYYNKWGIKHPFVRHELNLCAKACNKLKVSLLPDFNRANKNPFEAYKTSVSEIYQLSTLMLNIALDEITPGQEYSFNSSVDETVGRFSNWKFNSTYDYSTFVLYVLWHCRGKSSKMDKAISSRILQMLDESSTMNEFLKRI